jgi:dTDP-4-amino-4,6-dideoxygalactose transaminase
LAQRYHELLADVEEVALPLAREGSGHTYQSYVIRLLRGGRGRRNEIMDVLAASNIQTRPGTHAVHRLGYYAEKYGLRAEHYPVAAACEDTSITLPVFPGMTVEQQCLVVDALRQALAPSSR